MVSIDTKSNAMKTITALLGFYLNLLSYISPRAAGRLGVKLFCRPLRARMKDYHNKFLDTAEQFSFDYDGVRVQAYRWGNGRKKILFIHGWQSHSFRWKAYIDAFSKEDYTLYAFDAPGHGRSEGNFVSVPYYTEVILQLIASIGSVDGIISHSLGSFSSLYAFYEQNNLPVNKLVLMAPPGEASDFIQFYRQTLGLTNRTVDFTLKQFEKRFGKPITFFSTPKFATAVHIPCLIIHDEEDLETSVRYSELIHQAIPTSKFTRTKGIGHNLKSPDVLKEIVDFINAPSSSLTVNGKQKLAAI